MLGWHFSSALVRHLPEIMIAIVCHCWLSESAIQKHLGERMATFLSHQVEVMMVLFPSPAFFLIAALYQGFSTRAKRKK